MRHSLTILLVATLACGAADAGFCQIPHSVATIGDSNSIQHGNPKTFAELWRDATNPKLLADNWAVGGTTAHSNGLAQAQASIIGGARTWTTVAFGTNDCDTGVDPSVIVDDLQTITSDLAAAGTRVVLLNIPPQKNYFAWSTGIQVCIDVVNAGMTSTHDATCIVDQYAALGSASDARAMDASFDSGDGLHTNSAGKQKVADAILITCGAM